MNVNQKGVIGLTQVIADLAKKGYECFLPVHDYSAVDLIVMKDGITKRLQVKYREFKSGVAEIGFSSVINGKKVPIDLNLIDGWAIYFATVDKVGYVNKVSICTNGLRYREYPGKITGYATTAAPVPLYTTVLDETVLWGSGEMVAAQIC